MMATDTKGGRPRHRHIAPGIASASHRRTDRVRYQPDRAGAPPPSLPPCDGSGAPTTFACTPIGDQLPPDTIAPPPPQEITITGAEQVLLFAQSYTGDEGWLVPAYRFTTSDGVGPTVLAIDDMLPPPAR